MTKPINRRQMMLCLSTAEYVAGTVSLRLQQIDVRVESKTYALHFRPLSLLYLCDTLCSKESRRRLLTEVCFLTRSSDNVFVELVVSVQFKVDDNQTYNFFYTLSDVRRQLTSFMCAQASSAAAYACQYSMKMVC